MPPPTDNNGTQPNGFFPPEFHGTQLVVMNDELQHAYAQQMLANADHTKEVTRRLRSTHNWQIGLQMLAGLGVGTVIFLVGMGIGVAFF